MLHITFYFLLPIIFVIFGMRIAAIMPMPKTSVNKNRNLFLQKNEIRMSYNFIITPPPSNSILFKKLN